MTKSFGIIAFSFLLALSLFISGCKKSESFPQTVTDIDGNIYKTVKIGNQVWMAENLKVNHYRNGDEIPEILDGLIWDYLSTGASCTYDHSDSIATIYGNLYNWHAVNDSRKLAPDGWHIPTDEEWESLNSYLGEFAGGKMKEEDTIHWRYPNVGATNETGFNALPAGIRASGSGEFKNLQKSTCWWASSSDCVHCPVAWRVSYDQSELSRNDYYPTLGFSVRCIMD